jgi:muramidase (phage lysozyme)
MARLAVVKIVDAFLDLISMSEGTCTNPNTHDDGYDIIVSGVHGFNSFADYSAHPFAAGRTPIIVRPAKAAVLATPTPRPNDIPKIIKAAVPALESTASGRYQITLPTWREITNTWESKLFNPPAQDAAALQLLSECSALDYIHSGKIAAAIEASCETWASFPGNKYILGGRSLNWLLKKYAQLLAPEGDHDIRFHP